MSDNNVVVAPKRNALKSRYNQVLVGVGASLPLLAMAEVDMSEATTQIALGVAAVGALGAAKMAPAALTWVWSLVTGMAKR
jgi:hypothetical protein